MEEYNAVVASSLSAENVGGSDACLAAVSTGHQAVGESLSSNQVLTQY